MVPENKNALKVTVSYTDTAKSTAKKAASFLKARGIEAKPIIAAATAEFEGKVKTFPLSCPVCEQLVLIGCHKYHECNTSNGYRILYSYDESGNVVTVHAILSQKQDIQQLLYSRIIER